jgi:hypothetical protein
MTLSSADMKRLCDLGVTLEAATVMAEMIERYSVTRAPSRTAMTGAERARKYREKRKFGVTKTVTPPPEKTVTGIVIVPHTPLEKTPSLPVFQEVLKKESKVIARDDEQGFSELWAVFPKRDGNNPRKPALQSYLRALKKGATKEEICDGALRYTAHCDAGTRFVQQCVTWLNQEGWKNEYVAGKAKQSELMDAGDRLIGKLQARGRDRDDAERDRNQNGLFDPLDTAV